MAENIGNPGEGMNQNMYQLQVLQQQLQYIEQQKIQMQQRLNELKVTDNTIEGLKSNEKEMILPIGGGLFVEGDRKDVESVLVPVGAGVLVTKKIKDAKDYLDKMVSTVASSIDQLEKQIAKLSEKYNELLKGIDQTKQ